MIGNLGPTPLGSIRDRKIQPQINANARKWIENIDGSEIDSSRFAFIRVHCFNNFSARSAS